MVVANRRNRATCATCCADSIQRNMLRRIKCALTQRREKRNFYRLKKNFENIFIFFISQTTVYALVNNYIQIMG